MNTKQSAFTLVELLVTVTIITILATIASIYFFKSFGDSRDAARTSSIKNIGDTLELFYVENSYFPDPDDSAIITYDGGIAWEQGVFGKTAGLEIRSFGQDIPVDPEYKNFFSYSITNNGNEFQIGAIIESPKNHEEVTNLGFVSQAQAKVETAFVRGNYNEIMFRVAGDSGITYIASPSIIANDLSSTGAIDIIVNQKLVYDEFFNLPASYSDFLDTNKGFNFGVTDPIVFSGSTQELKTELGMRNFVDKLQYIYAITPTESFDKYISFLQDDGVSKMKKFLTKNFNVSFSYAFSCQDLYDEGVALESDYYEIDPDGTGPLPLQTVYCDIIPGGKGFTKVGENHLGANGGDFAGRNHVATNFYTLFPSSGDNIISANTTVIPNPINSYVMHQTGDYRSNYEVHFADFSQVKVGDEIRMTLWVSENDDGGWSGNLGLNPSSGYMMHNRIFYTDGTFSSNGETEVLQVQNIGGRDWKQIQTKHVVRKEPQEFSWYIGLDAEDTKDLYFTGVNLELFRH